MALPMIENRGQNPEYVDERFMAIEAELVDLRKDHNRLKWGFMIYVGLSFLIALLLY